MSISFNMCHSLWKSHHALRTEKRLQWKYNNANSYFGMPRSHLLRGSLSVSGSVLSEAGDRLWEMILWRNFSWWVHSRGAWRWGRDLSIQMPEHISLLCVHCTQLLFLLNLDAQSFRPLRILQEKKRRKLDESCKIKWWGQNKAVKKKNTEKKVASLRVWCVGHVRTCHDFVG